MIAEAVPPHLEFLRLAVDGGVGRLMLHRPRQRNALWTALLATQSDAETQAAQQRDIAARQG